MIIVRSNLFNLNTGCIKQAIMLPPEIDWLIVMFAWAEYDLQKFHPVRPADFSLKEEVDWVCNNVGKIPDAFLAPQIKTVGDWKVPNPLRVFYPFYPPSLIRWRRFFFSRAATCSGVGPHVSSRRCSRPRAPTAACFAATSTANRG